MMKAIFTTILLSVAFSIQANDNEKEVKSTIKEVTVYLKGAQITRTASANIASGTSILVFKDVSARIDKQSIQVESTGDLKVLAVSSRLNYLEEKAKPELVASIEAKLEDFDQLIAENNSLLEVYAAEEVMLISNGSIGGEQSGVNVQELKSAVTYFRERLLDIKSKKRSLSKDIDKYKLEQEKLKAQLREINNKEAEPSTEILITVNAKSPQKTSFKISYLVKEAGWLPSYDIRVKDVSSPLAVNYKANVFQHTGRDWNKVKLTLSTADPSQTGTKPSIEPWYLGFNYSSYSNRLSGSLYGSRTPSGTPGHVYGRITDEYGQSIPGVNVIIKGTTIGTVTDFDGNYSIPVTGDANQLVYSFIGYDTQEINVNGRSNINLKLPEASNELSEVVVTGMASKVRIRGASSIKKKLKSKKDFSPVSAIEQKNIAASQQVRTTDIEFKVEQPYSIKSDGKRQAVDMVAYDIDAYYQYYCAPKLDDDAFLTASVTDWEEYNFLAGEASLFFEGKFVGKSVLDVRNVKDTLNISLGRDKNVTITRDKVKDFASSQFIGGNRKESLAFEINIRNKKQQAINLIIEDQFPISSNKDIVIDRIEDSEAKHNEDTGLLKWDLKLDPGKTEKLALKYSVKYPKGQTLLLE
ncbi:MAG: mucoidy inhibitor MuiA family protein [Bacteroidota bacterium]